MYIKTAILKKVDIPLKKPFETSFAALKHKKCIILILEDEDGTMGYGEASAFEEPFYNEEFRDASWSLLENQLLPLIVKKNIDHPDDLYSIIEPFRKNNMSKSAINCALWDIYAKQQEKTLASALGGKRHKIETGVSVGVQSSPKILVEKVHEFIEEGYKRIKMKIKPGKDYDYLAAVRKAFPHAILMADANSAYRLQDIERLKQLDKLGLIMIEQPLEPDDLVDHAALQAQLKTSICLDESIQSLEDTRKAIQLKSGKIINIKVARVGGLTIAKQIQKLAAENGIACWCGGMLDSGIARAANIAVATLPGFILPNDIAASERYFNEDIIKPSVKLNGTFVNVPEKYGIGFDIDEEHLAKFTIQEVHVN